MKLLLSKFGTPKGRTVVSQGISCLPARFMAEPREKPFGEVLRMKSWVFIGRTDAEAETPILWPPNAKSWLIGKDPDAGRDWGQEEKGTTEDEMAGWHHRLNEHEFGWTPGVGDGQGGLSCCHSWGCKETDTTEWLNWTERRMLGELPHAERGLHSWLLMTAPPDCSRPGCCREVKQEDGFGCRTCCVPAICLWADPTAVLCPFHLLHPNSEQYTEGISHPLLASPHLNTVPRLKKKKSDAL